MNTVHKIVERGLLTLFAICFAFVTIYVPQIKTVEAGAAAGGSTFIQQLVDTPLAFMTKLSSGAASLSAKATVFLKSNQWLKDVGLDGIAWTLSKSVLSRMTSSVVSWINTGFEGSPSFIKDLGGFLRDIADQEFYTYLKSLDSNFSFLCAPFKLDIKIALNISYQMVASGQPAKSCTFSSMINNVQKFTDQTSNFVDAGGWDTWFAITSNPTKYTGVGSMMTAESEMRARLVNAEGKELKLLNFGDGFLSKKNCQTVNSGASAKTNCTITTPGKVINETLTKQLGSGQDALVTADELNEVITALFSQVAVKTIGGINGLLGLSGSTGYTAPGTPFVDALDAANPGNNPESIVRIFRDAVENENNYATLLRANEQPLLNFANDPTNTRNDLKREAMKAYNEIGTRLVVVENNRSLLNSLSVRMVETQANTSLSAAGKSERYQAIAQEYFQHRDWHGREFVASERDRYESILNP